MWTVLLRLLLKPEGLVKSLWIFDIYAICIQDTVNIKLYLFLESFFRDALLSIKKALKTGIQLIFNHLGQQ
jgi:hypothetical protein